MLSMFSYHVISSRIMKTNLGTTPLPLNELKGNSLRLIIISLTTNERVFFYCGGGEQATIYIFLYFYPWFSYYRGFPYYRGIMKTEGKVNGVQVDSSSLLLYFNELKGNNSRLIIEPIARVILLCLGDFPRG